MSYNMAMKVSRTDTVCGLWDELNQSLFPWIDDNIGELDAAHRLFIAVCEAVINLREFDYAMWKGNGRPPASRLKILKAFLLKAVLNVKDTKELVRMLRAEPLSRRLCGWDSPGLVPSQSRFSRVFGEFAERGFTDAWFAEMIVKYHGDTPVETVSYGDGVERPNRPRKPCPGSGFPPHIGKSRVDGQSERRQADGLAVNAEVLQLPLMVFYFGGCHRRRMTNPVLNFMPYSASTVNQQR